MKLGGTTLVFVGILGSLQGADFNASRVDVSRPTESRLWENLRVSDFGAKCDGATDDSAAIQGALNVNSRLGGTVVNFPAGTCVAVNLQVHSNTIIQGQGDQTSVRMKSASSNTSALFMLTASTNVTFQNLQMDGNAAGQSGPTDFTSTIVRLASNGPASGPARVTLYRVTSHDAFGHHFLSYVGGGTGDRPSSYISITESSFTNSGTDAIYWDDIDHLKIADNTISNWGLSTPESDGIGGYTRGHRYGFTISGNQMNSGAGRKFSVELFQQGVGDDYNDVELGDNVLTGNSGWNGFSISSFGANIYTNVFTGGGGNNSRSGLYELTLAGGIVSGNVIQGGVLALTPSYPGIVLGSIAITGNTIIAGAFPNINAVEIGGTIQNVNFIGNLVDVTGTTSCRAIIVGLSDGVRASATQVTIANNQILDNGNSQHCIGIDFESMDGANQAVVRGNSIHGMSLAILNTPGPTVGTTGITLAGNNWESNAALIVNNGTGLMQQSDNIATPGMTLEMLNGGTFIDALGRVVSTTGALPPVAFTPGGTGWYRILLQANGGSLGGVVRIAADLYDNTQKNLEFQFSHAASGGPLPALRGIPQVRILNNDGGAIDQVRGSYDDLGSVAVDIHVMTTASVERITGYYLGPDIPQPAVVPSPVIGAILLHD